MWKEYDDGDSVLALADGFVSATVLPIEDGWEIIVKGRWHERHKEDMLTDAKSWAEKRLQSLLKLALSELAIGEGL